MESNQHREPWNKGKPIGQKPPLKLKDIWAIWIHLQNESSLFCRIPRWLLCLCKRPLFALRRTGGFGRIARVAHPAGYGADQSLEWQLCGTGD